MKRRSQSLFLMRKTNGSSRMSVLPSFDEGNGSEGSINGVETDTSKHSSVNEEKEGTDYDSEYDYEYDASCYMEVKPF